MNGTRLRMLRVDAVDSCSKRMRPPRTKLLRGRASRRRAACNNAVSTPSYTWIIRVRPDALVGFTMPSALPASWSSTSAWPRHRCIRVRMRTLSPTFSATALGRRSAVVHTTASPWSICAASLLHRIRGRLRYVCPHKDRTAVPLGGARRHQSADSEARWPREVFPVRRGIEFTNGFCRLPRFEAVVDASRQAAAPPQ